MMFGSRLASRPAGRRAGGVLWAAVLLFVLQVAPARGQVQDYDWATPHRLSTYPGVFKSDSHAVATDAYGYVHVFWVEQMLDLQSAAIMYARFDGESWSQPLDILLSSSPIDRLSAAVDPAGTLYLAWTAGLEYRSNPIYIVQAPAHNAASARHWSKPQKVSVKAHLLALQAESAGVLHLVFSEFFGRTAGVYYLRSSDGGLTWPEPVWLDPDIPSGMAPGTLEFAMAEAGSLHLTWFYTPVDETGGDWIRYAQSTNGGQSWSAPVTIARNDDGDPEMRAAAGPVMAVQGQTVHIVWAAGTLNYRNHRFSTDGGQTWSVPRRFLGNLNGQAGDGLVFDAAGRLHLTAQIRYPQGIYHAYWSERRWEGPFLLYLIKQNSLDTIGERFHAHGLRLAVRAGQQLVLIFYDRAEDRPHVLYAMHTPLAAPPAAALVPTPGPYPTIAPAPALTPSPLPVQPAAETRLALAALLEEAGSAAAIKPAWPGTPISIGVLVTLLLVGAVISLSALRGR